MNFSSEFVIFQILLLLGIVHGIGLLPSPQGVNWYPGQKVYIQAVQTSSNDGGYYNAVMKKGSTIVEVYANAPYQKWVSFIVPSSFENEKNVTLAVIAEGATGKDSMSVNVRTMFDWHARWKNQRYRRPRRNPGCGGCAI